MRLLVTGGAGFIGSHFCLSIINDVEKLVILDKINYCANLNNIEEIMKKVVLVRSDIVQSNLEKIFEENKIDTLVHFAAQTHVDNSYNGFFEFIHDNVLSTHVLLEACKNYGKMEKILCMSTDEIYGPNNKQMNENSPFNPTNPYSASKASAEMIINSYKYSYKLPIIIIRCNNVYGPKQYPEKVIPKFINQIITDKPLSVHGNGHKTRDFIYIDDVVNALKLVLTQGNIGEIYNIGADNPQTILNLAEKLISFLGKGTIEYIQDRPFNDDRYYINCDKIKTLGWIPQVSWEDGLNRTINWFVSHTGFWKVREIESEKINSFNDSRGVLKFTPLPASVKQQFLSVNKKNVVRGIHCSPYGKFITCLQGSVMDFIINLDNGSLSYLSVEKIMLKEGDRVYVPPNYGHAFLSLEDDTHILYQLEGMYDPDKERNINLFDPYLSLGLNLDTSPAKRAQAEPAEYIISEKDMSNPFIRPVDYIVLGASGFIGSNICKVLSGMNKNFITLGTRLENVRLLEKRFVFYKPKYVISSAGISGRPTVKWCEEHKEETLHTNLTCQLLLANLCQKLGIHLTIIGSGLIFSGRNKVYSEDDEANKTDLYYSVVRGLLEKSLRVYDNVLYLRVIYPISGDGNPKCLLSKLRDKESVYDIRINTTVLPKLLPFLPEIIEKGTTGILNFVNKGMVRLADLIAGKVLIQSDVDQPEMDISKLEKICGVIPTVL